MMFGEFLELAKLTGTEENYNMYTNDIEPAYMNMPGGFDKKTFVKWWENNKDLCKWISHLITEKDNIQKELREAVEQKEELEVTILDKQIKINGLKQDIEEKDLFIKELEKSKEDAIYSLRLSIAFAPDKTMNDLRLYFFPKYEEAKKDAIEQGIING